MHQRQHPSTRLVEINSAVLVSLWHLTTTSRGPSGKLRLPSMIPTGHTKTPVGSVSLLKVALGLDSPDNVCQSWQRGAPLPVIHGKWTSLTKINGHDSRHWNPVQSTRLITVFVPSLDDLH